MTNLWSEGEPNAPLLFLAQAPSYMEKRLNQPLVGPSGEVFNNCLHTAGIVRRGVRILNLWHRVVHTNDKTGVITDEDHNIVATKSGLTEKGWELAGETLELIRTSGANCVVPLGREATQAALGDAYPRPILKWRGSIIEGSERIGKKKCIPTIHPAATIHGVYLWRYLIIGDMEKASRHSAFPELRLPQRTHIIAPSFADAVAYLNRGRVEKRVATDLEVINHQVACFSICYDPKETMVIPLTTQEGGDYWSLDEEMDIWTLYARLMEDPEVDKINQNIVGFDSPFLFYQMGIRTLGFLGDTMIAQKIMYPEFKKGLDFITSIRTDEPYYKDEGKMWKGLGGPIEQFWTYCGKDAAVALEAWDDMVKEMTEDEYWPTYRRVARLANPLTYMSTRGFKADMDRLKETTKRVDKHIEELYDELKAVSEYEFNPLSPKQCQQYFYVTKNCHPYTGKTGNVTTDDKAMARIFRRYGLREAKLVQEIRAAEKLKGTYLEINFDKDSRLRCSWDPTGTKFGRLSSSQTVFDTGANMQNLHPEFKEFLVADKEPIDGQSK